MRPPKKQAVVALVDHHSLTVFDGVADLADLAQTLLDHYRRKDHETRWPTALTGQR